MKTSFSIQKSDLRLSKSAYFYKMIHDSQLLDDETVERILSKVLLESEPIDEPPYLWKEVRAFGVPDAYTISGVIFRRHNRPAFIPDNLEHLEVKYGYLLIMEYDGYLAISKKYAKGFETAIEGIAYQLPEDLLSKVATSGPTKIERMSAVNTDRSTNAILSKSLSADNLENQSAPFENRSYALRSYRVKKKEGKGLSVSLSTGRAGENGKASPIDEFAKFVIAFVKDLHKASKAGATDNSNAFVNSFSKPIAFQNRPNGLTPLKITLDGRRLEHHLEEQECDLRIKSKNQELLGVDIETLNEILDRELPIIRDENTKRFRMTSPLGKNYPLKLDPNMYLEMMQTKVKLHLPKLRKYCIVPRGEPTAITTLEEYFNDQENIIIQFDDPNYTYIDNQLFENRDLMQHFEALLTTMIPSEELKNCVSEKGDLSTTSTEFPEDSIFGFVEKHLVKRAGCSYLICDDLGRETADFIGGTKDTLCFFHCKSNCEKNRDSNPGFRNAKYDSVASQILHSLEDFNMTMEQMEAKVQSACSNYRLDKIPTKIPRLRMPSSSPMSILDIHRTYSMNPNSHRRIYMVINFLSLSEVEKTIDMERARSGRQPALLRLLWRINRLMAACKNARGTDLYIVCLP